MRLVLQSKLFSVSALLLFSISCFGALGGDIVSVQSDQAHMRAQRSVTQTTAYTVHQMQADTGIVVREFVSPQGKVFGVSWQGPVRPDLQQLLGSYYDEYQRNAPTKRSHGPVTIETPSFVIQSGGHQGNLTGRAYVPEMVPSNVRVEEIK